MSSPSRSQIDALIIRTDSKKINVRMRINNRCDRLSIHVMRPEGGTIRLVVPHVPADGLNGLMVPIGELMRMLTAFGEISDRMARDATKHLSSMMAAAVISGQNPPAMATMKDIDNG